MRNTFFFTLLFTSILPMQVAAGECYLVNKAGILAEDQPEGFGYEAMLKWANHGHSIGKGHGWVFVYRDFQSHGGIDSEQFVKMTFEIPDFFAKERKPAFYKIKTGYISEGASGFIDRGAFSRGDQMSGKIRIKPWGNGMFHASFEIDALMHDMSNLDPKPPQWITKKGGCAVLEIEEADLNSWLGKPTKRPSFYFEPLRGKQYPL